MKKRDNIRFKGTTLVETLSAMTLIVIVFGIAMMVYSNVMANSGLSEKSRVYPILQSQMEKAIIEEDFKNGNVEIEGLIVRKKVEKYGNFNGVFHIRLSAELQEKEILSIERLIHLNEDKK